MDIELPTQGCNIVYGNYVDNYRNNVRTRYYIINQKLVQNSTSSYSSLPTGYSCYSGKLEYSPELKIYLPFLSLALITLVMVLIYKIILKRLVP